MNYRYVVMNESPPIVYIYEVAAKNKSGKKVDIMQGDQAQHYIDTMKHEILVDVAAWKVENDPQLLAHRGFILDDWDEGDEHLEWICVAPVEEILDWVKAAK